MGGGGVSNAGAQTYTTPTEATQAGNLGQKLWATIFPNLSEAATQGMELLKTGGTAASIPSVQRAVESSKLALSNTLKQLTGNLASSGLGGTPYAESAKANTTMQGEQAASQAGTQAGSSLMQYISQLLGGTATAGTSLMGQATQGGISALGSTANSSNQAMQSNTSKGNTDTMALSNMMPKAQCCFIFLAAEGMLHPVVRMYRDSHATVHNVRGYCRLSDVLVPLMQRLPVIKHAVRLLMTQPLTSYGKYHYGLNPRGLIFKPFERFWMKLFTRLGNCPPYTRKGTDEVV